MMTNILCSSSAKGEHECVQPSPWIDWLIEVFVIPSTQHIKQKDVAFGGLKTEKVCCYINVLHIWYCCSLTVLVEEEDKLLQKMKLAGRKDRMNYLAGYFHLLD